LLPFVEKGHVSAVITEVMGAGFTLLAVTFSILPNLQWARVAFRQRMPSAVTNRGRRALILDLHLSLLGEVDAQSASGEGRSVY
jgi:hypothetical protein